MIQSSSSFRKIYRKHILLARDDEIHLFAASKPVLRHPFLPRKPRVGCLRTSLILWKNSVLCWLSFFPPRCSSWPMLRLNGDLFFMACFTSGSN